MATNRTSILPSLGLETLAGTEEGQLSELGVKVKALVSTYEDALYIRRESKVKRPPVDIYSQMVRGLRSNLEFEEYRQVVDLLVDEVVATLQHDRKLWHQPYGHSLEVNALRNLHSFVTVAMKADEE
jgi:hypothetical protein